MRYFTRLLAIGYMLTATIVPVHAIMMYIDPIQLYAPDASVGTSIPITVTNTGSEDVWLPEQGNCHSFFSIQDNGGNELSLISPDTMCTMEFRTMTLAAGETKTLGTWNQKAYGECPRCTTEPCPLMESESYPIWCEQNPYQVPAGTYTVTTTYATNENLDTTNARTIAYSFRIGSSITPKPVFSDVPSTYWAYDHIMFLYNEGIANGYSDRTFKPDWSITKAEVVKIALNAAGIQLNTYVQAPSPYKDVTASHSLAYYVDTAKSRGFLADEEYFRPDEKATRFFTLQVLIDALGQTPNVQNYAAAPSAFSDVSASNTEEKAYTNYAAESGIVSGYGDGTYRPSSNVSRAEMAKIVHNLGE